MWANQTSRVKSLRRAAAREPHEPANPDDEVHLDVVVYADRMDGDLDSFVAGICDGLQPPHPNFLPWLHAEDWEDVPETGRPPHALGFRDDRAITKITAERQPPSSRRGYDVTISW